MDACSGALPARSAHGFEADNHIVIPTAPHSWSFLIIDSEDSNFNLYLSVSPVITQAQVYVSCDPRSPSSLHCIGLVSFAVDEDPEQVLDLPFARGLMSM